MTAEYIEFDPHNPLCTHCGQCLTKKDRFGEVRYEKQKATMFQMLCPICKTIVGFMIKDQFDPTVPYIVERLIPPQE